MFIKILGNLVAPLVSGLFLFIFFLYFQFVEDSRRGPQRYFKVFLITFSLYLFGRPVQIFLGPDIAPLLINNVRSLLFAAVTVPMVILADFSRPERNRQTHLLIIFAAGTLLGVIYWVFNTLGTSGTMELFRIGDLVAWDNLTPSRTPPYYGREVTIAVYTILGLMLSGDSLVKSFRVAGLMKDTGRSQQKVILYNVGKLVFGLTFIFGALAMQWWIYYVGSILSASFLGYGVILDIREKRFRMNKVVAHIRQELIQDFSINPDVRQQVSQLLELLRIPRSLNTMMVLRLHTGDLEESARAKMDESLERGITRLVVRSFGGLNFIMMPLGPDMYGICLPVQPEQGKQQMTELAEEIRRLLEETWEIAANIGIGGSYNGLDDLKRSYQEAVNALELASSIDGGQVIHTQDIRESPVEAEYPFKERDAFLSAVKIGDLERAEANLAVFISRLVSWDENANSLLRIRLYELLGSIIDAAIAGGGDVEELFQLSRQLYSEAHILRTIDQLKQWLSERTTEIIGIVARSHSSRTGTIVRKAMDYIHENYHRQISVQDVAGAVNISESYLKSIFKKISGYSYSEYLTKTRLDRARDLLVNTELSVMEIAMEIGYQTPGSFSTIFRKHFGISPSHYRSAGPNNTIADN